MKSRGDTAEKLVGWALTIFGLLVPILFTVVAIGNDPSISPRTAQISRISLLYFGPAVLLLAFHIVVCFLIMRNETSVRLVNPLITAVMIIVYMTLGLLAWMMSLWM